MWISLVEHLAIDVVKVTVADIYIYLRMCGDKSSTLIWSVDCIIVEKAEGPKKKKLGTEIGKAAAEKSGGLFSADDWQCNKYSWCRHNHHSKYKSCLKLLLINADVETLTGREDSNVTCATRQNLVKWKNEQVLYNVKYLIRAVAGNKFVLLDQNWDSSLMPLITSVEYSWCMRWK